MLGTVTQPGFFSSSGGVFDPAAHGPILYLNAGDGPKAVYYQPSLKFDHRFTDVWASDIGPDFAVSRASVASYFDSSGTLQSAAANEGRVDYDPGTLVCKGRLIEFAATNLFLNSAVPVTQNITVSAVAYVISFYGTGTITLSGVHSHAVVGTGANDLTKYSFTPTAGTLTCTVSGTTTHAQLETGSIETSRVVTTGASATRQADVITVSGTNFSGFYSATEGTIFVEAISRNPGGTTALLTFSDGSGLNLIKSFYSTSNHLYVSNGSPVVTLDADTQVANSTSRIGATWKANNFAVALNGGAEATDVAGTIPAVNRLNLGSNHVGAQQLNGWVKSFYYWPIHASDLTL